MRQFTLTAAEFRSLASGYGSPSAVAALVAGQAAKRQLLLYAVAKRARMAGGAIGRAAADAVALLLKVAEETPDAVRTVLGHPYVDAWAVRFVRRMDAAGRPPPDDEIGYFCAIAAAAAVRAGRGFEILVPPAAGVITLPGLGLVRDSGAGPVQVRGDGTALTIRAGHFADRVSAPYDAETEHWLPRRPVSPTVALEDVDQYRDCYPWPATCRLDAPDLARLVRLWDDARNVLRDDHPRHTPAIDAVVAALVPLEHPGGPGHYSATTRRTFGAVGIVPPTDPALLAMLILHEAQHLKLGALLDLVELYRPGGEPHHRAPWRTDPRPVGALLQGAYAHLGVADFWRVRRTRGLADASRAEREFAYWRDCCLEAARTLAGSGELTDLGDAFVADLHATLAAWRSEPVAPAAERTARVCGLVGELAWRIAHGARTPNLEELRRAFRAGEPCPDLPPWRVAPGRHGAAPRIVAAVSQDAPDLPDADLALLGGRHREAERLYARRLRAAPSDEDWAALAATLIDSGQIDARRARPEVARELHAALGDPPPGDVLRWCAR